MFTGGVSVGLQIADDCIVCCDNPIVPDNKIRVECSPVVDLIFFIDIIVAYIDNVFYHFKGCYFCHFFCHYERSWTAMEGDGHVLTIPSTIIVHLFIQLGS